MSAKVVTTVVMKSGLLWVVKATPVDPLWVPSGIAPGWKPYFLADRPGVVVLDNEEIAGVIVQEAE